MAGSWLWLRTDCDNRKQRRSRGRRRFLRLLRGGRAVVAGPIAGDRTVGGKRPEQQGRVGGLRQRVEVVVAGEAATEAALEEKGRWWPTAGAGLGRRGAALVEGSSDVRLLR
ncbi:hypothetical protein BHE74_00022011 [Ensete ventricosum]|nr:hypothetical protein GW17_00017668 [Ensete ventricosum]RWW70297.1 hypothetical protein BHE74_00022011 [Ensete ventricosum]